MTGVPATPLSPAVGASDAAEAPDRPVARTLYDITHTLSSLDGPSARIGRVLELLRALIPYDHCALLDARPEREPELMLASASAAQQAALAPVLRRLLELLSDQAPVESPPVPQPLPSAVPWDAHLAVPLVGMDRVTGVLFVARTASTPYGERDLGLLSVVAGQLAAYLTLLHLYTQAQVGLRLRDTVLAMVSHDLKNPLAAIQGHAQLLLRQLGRLDLPAGERLIHGAASIVAGAVRMTRQIDELLDAARLGAGETLTLRRRPTDLVALVEQVLAEQTPAAGERRLCFEPASSSLVGFWDSDRLERVVANLVSNAVKYSPDGTEIRVTVAEEEGVAVLRVRDNGIGIPQADLAHVFEPFRRAGNVGQYARGSGLGLSSVRAIVEQHGGSTSVESREGEGSTFIVRLPVSPPDAGAAAQ